MLLKILRSCLWLKSFSHFTWKGSLLDLFLLLLTKLDSRKEGLRGGLGGRLRHGKGCLRLLGNLQG